MSKRETYRNEHGHHPPLEYRTGKTVLLEEVREALPERVVLTCVRGDVLQPKFTQNLQQDRVRSAAETSRGRRERGHTRGSVTSPANRSLTTPITAFAWTSRCSSSSAKVRMKSAIALPLSYRPSSAIVKGKGKRIQNAPWPSRDVVHAP